LKIKINIAKKEPAKRLILHNISVMIDGKKPLSKTAIGGQEKVEKIS
jgi:hypothetical protein